MWNEQEGGMGVTLRFLTGSVLYIVMTLSDSPDTRVLGLVQTLVLQKSEKKPREVPDQPEYTQPVALLPQVCCKVK